LGPLPPKIKNLSVSFLAIVFCFVATPWVFYPFLSHDNPSIFRYPPPFFLLVDSQNQSSKPKYPLVMFSSRALHKDIFISATLAPPHHPQLLHIRSVFLKVLCGLIRLPPYASLLFLEEKFSSDLPLSFESTDFSNIWFDHLCSPCCQLLNLCSVWPTSNRAIDFRSAIPIYCESPYQRFCLQSLS